MPESLTTPNYAAMTSSDMYKALGSDAMKWAEAFCQFNVGMDREMMTTWFSNAMMAMYDANRRIDEKQN